MKRRTKLILLVISLVVFPMFFQPAFAQWSLLNISGTGLPQPPMGISGVILNILLWLLGVFALFGIIGFVVSGIMYLVSFGSDTAIQRAKKYMLYSIVGVVVGLSGFVIIKAVYVSLTGYSFYF